MTTSSLIPFEYDHNPIRIHIGDDGDPWFIASDVCDALGLGNVNKALTRLDADEKKQENCSDVNNNHHLLWMINESGLYSLTFTSRKPEARGFRRWVSGEVLPTIRKTGKYEVASTPLVALTPLEQLKLTVQILEDVQNQIAFVSQRVERIEDTYNAEQGAPQMMTVAAYAAWHKLRLSNKEVANAGKAAVTYSNRNGFAIQTMPHAVFGKVNLYHIDVLKQVFKQRRLFEGPGGAE